MILCVELKSDFTNLPSNNKDTTPGQFRYIDAPRDGLLNFLSESTQVVCKEQINKEKEYCEREFSSVL